MMQVDYTDYWRAALARHRALIAAGCLPMVGAIRAGTTKEYDNADEQSELPGELEGDQPAHS